MKKTILLIFLLLFPVQLLALDFSLHKKSGARPGPTLLVIGGIDGDEPGGFHAAAMLVTRYRIQQGTLWIVPNLNFTSIIKRVRGDMNLKFEHISRTDSQFRQVNRIKQIITEPEVDLVLNLHDGSGFYHPTRINRQRNPSRWGQSCVIDQNKVSGSRFGNLQKLAETSIRQINTRALSRNQRFRLKDVATRTVGKDIPARKSLSFFAVRNNKPAMAVEASKTHPVHIRTYYHLLALEAFMQQLGIGFSRDFDLTADSVKQAIKDDARITFADGRIQLELNNLRPSINNFPLPRNTGLHFAAQNPLITVLPYDRRFRIHYGNNRLAFLNPQYLEYDQSLNDIGMLIDGKQQQIDFGSIIPVDDSFLIQGKKGYRVNVIGYTRPGYRSDSDMNIAEGQLNKKYSIDTAGKLFRVEVYRKDKFSGMVLVDFRKPKEKPEALVAQTTPAEKRSPRKQGAASGAPTRFRSGG